MAEAIPVKAGGMFDFWKSHLVRYEESGLCGVEYCRNEGISYSRFHYWKQKLNNSLLSPSGPIKLVQIPVNLSASSLKSVAAEKSVSSCWSGLRIWKGDYCIEIPEDFSPVLLSGVLETLRRL